MMNIQKALGLHSHNSMDHWPEERFDRTTLPKTKVIASIKLLHRAISNENYIGWDPYDALNSSIIKKICCNIRFLEILAIQLNKYSPINIRNILRIEKGLDTKGVALLVNAYSRLFSITNDEEFMKSLLVLVERLKERSLRSTYGFDCWAGHYFDYTAADGLKKTPSDPDIVATANAIIALISAYEILKDTSLKERAINAANGLLKKFLTCNGNDLYFKYYIDDENKIVLNASSHGLESISTVLAHHYNERMLEVLERVAGFLIKNQREDGSWVYSIYRSGKTRTQLDFHQGYIIDGLTSFFPYSNNKNTLITAIKKATDFYMKRLFFKNGRSYYRHPSKYPTDIHNQAQGIITFSKLYLMFGNIEYLNFSTKIAKWTIDNMQDTNGFFYYQKWPFVTNKIPYMRWSQSWMMLALSFLLESKKGEKQ